MKRLKLSNIEETSEDDDEPYKKFILVVPKKKKKVAPFQSDSTKYKQILKEEDDFFLDS